MIDFFKTYFKFSTTERQGILVLVVLIVAVFSVPMLYNWLRPQDKYDFTAFQKKIADIKSMPDNPEQTNTQEQNITIEYFPFNPNTIKFEDLIRLGLTPKQAHTLINYRHAGGEFKEPSDIMNVYGIGEQVYQKIQNYIKIPKATPSVKTKNTDIDPKISTEQPKTSHQPTKDTKKRVTIPINSADSIDLIKLNGIGPAYARRILSYRDFLGGFYHVNQLDEVYGLPPELVLQIKKNLTIDTLQLVKIELNSTDFSSLNKHPYISYTQTKTILKYRSLMGGFNSLNELIKNNLLDSAAYNKVSPYLSVNIKSD